MTWTWALPGDFLDALPSRKGYSIVLALSVTSVTDKPNHDSAWVPAVEKRECCNRWEVQLCVNEFVPCDWCSIFNTPEFFKLHRGNNAFYFQLCMGDPAIPIGVAHFCETEAGHFRSPRRGTFGGFEFSRSVRIEVLEAFVDQVEKAVVASGAASIEILEPPTAFDPAKSALLANVLHRRGYTCAVPDLAFLLAVNGEDSIWQKLKPSRRQRINRCRREGMTVAELGPDSYRQAYEVIVKNREVKGFPVTMSFDSIVQMTEVFPGKLTFFGVFKDGAMIAASICVNVNPSVFYVFYWGDLPGYERSSPVSLLAEWIYDHARRQGFRFIDFGTSTKDGVPIYGLMNFKKEIGCFPSLKPAYVKKSKG